MAISRRVSHAESISMCRICLYGLLAFALVSLMPRAYAHSPKPGTGGDNFGFTIANRSKAGLTADAGEFYRVAGRKIRLLRSLEKVAVRHKRDQGPAISGRLKTRQTTGRPFAVEQELAREQMLIMRASGVSSLAELDEAVSQIQQESEVERVTPVYINEETGLEMIVTDEFIVKLAPQATLEQLEVLNGRMGTTLSRRLDGTTDQFILSMDSFSPEGLLTMCGVYSDDPTIVWASPNFLSQVVLDSFGGDFEYLPSQWHLEKIDAAGAWDITSGSKDIVVAVIDDGVDVDHEDLRGSFPDNDSDHSDNGYTNDYYGWNFYSDNSDPRPSDVNDNHGTWVTGVIAANGNNAEGILGCAYNCTLMALKVQSGDDWVSDAQIAKAILYAAGFHRNGRERWRGADVINMSFHMPGAKWEINDALHKAASEGRGGKGCLVFCSSGNDYAGWTYSGVNFQSGNTYTFRWEYSKGPSGSQHEGTVWLDSVVFPDGDVECFEGGKPSDWRTGGNSNWTCIQDGLEGNHAMTGWNGQNSKAMRAGPVGSNQSCWLEITKSVSEGSFEFWYWPAMELGEELEFTIRHGNETLYTSAYSSKKTQDYIPYIPVVAYPASHPDTIAVGASTNFDYRADYSRYGFGLDFVAPSKGGSESIHTTDRTDTNIRVNGAEGNYYSGFGGTSAATPLAASVGALMLSTNPDLTPEQVRAIMQDTCEQIGNEPYSEAFDNDPNTNRYYGHGRINANLAVNAAKDSPASMVVFEDTFPERTIDSSKWTRVSNATVDDMGIGEPSWPYSLRLNGGNMFGSVESRVIDLSSYTKVTLTYSYQYRAGDNLGLNWLAIEYHNGSKWMPVNEKYFRYNMATFKKVGPIDLPAAALQANFRLRIRHNGGLVEEGQFGDSANLFVDDVKLTTSSEGPDGMVFVSINDSGAGMEDSDGNPISHGGFNGQMSKYETTNAQFCEFLNAARAEGLIKVNGYVVYAASDTNLERPYFTVSAKASGSQIHYSNPTFGVRTRNGYSMDNHPVVYVTWYGATAFCDYYGYRLPTQWEWQAVADYDGSYTYGCGTTISQSKANYNQANPLDLTSRPWTTPVGYYNYYVGHGLYDLAGNVYEWTSSIVDGKAVFRGGGFWNDAPWATTSTWFLRSPEIVFDSTGFRVCR